MAEHGPEEPPLSEPVIVQDAFATGVDIESVDGEIRLIGWVSHQDEHRIVARLVMPNTVARALLRDLRKVLAAGGN